MSPVDRALAKVLAAVIEWDASEGRYSHSDIPEATVKLQYFKDVLTRADLIDRWGASPAGRDLLDRARRAGVL